MFEKDKQLIVRVEGLSIQTNANSKSEKIVENIFFKIREGEFIGITGESGSGKSLTMLALLGLINSYPNLKMSGSITLFGEDTRLWSKEKWNSIRSKSIALVLQQPMTAFNPMRKIYGQLEETIINHKLKSSNIKAKIFEALEFVGLTEHSRILNSYPHELSGGQLQRLCIAMAMINSPKILIADEPTASLDTSSSEQILALLSKCSKEKNTTVLLVTHDLINLKKNANKILLFQKGQIVSTTDMSCMQDEALDAYTFKYLNTPNTIQLRPFTIPSTQNILEVKELHKTYVKTTLFKKSKVSVLTDINFKISGGEMLGLSGDSGTGKSTLGNIISGILPYSGGKISLNGQQVNQKCLQQDISLRQSIQIVFQDPFNSLNPMLTIGQHFLEVFKMMPIKIDKENFEKLIIEKFNIVHLPHEVLNKYRHQISGGQRQKVALIKLILLAPKIVVFDEAFSNLDMYQLEEIIHITLELQATLNFAGLFISHDPYIISRMCHKSAFIENGRLVEYDLVSNLVQKENSRFYKSLLSRGIFHNSK